jgi:hypothetical protein
MVANGSIVTFSAIFASGWIFANGCFIYNLSFLEPWRLTIQAPCFHFLFVFYYLSHELSFRYNFASHKGVTFHDGAATTHFFNIISPLMSIFIAATGYKIVKKEA